MRDLDTSSGTSTDSRPTTPLTSDHLGFQDITSTLSSDTSHSDLDSDPEPEQLVTKYLALRSRLYELSPESIQINGRKQKDSEFKSSEIEKSLDYSLSRRLSRIKSKLSKIESDILFDQDEANRQWEVIQISLAREYVDRKRLGISNTTVADRSSTGRSSNTHKPIERKSTEQVDDSESMLGNIFSSLPDVTDEDGTGTSGMSTQETNGSTVKIRDFGKWNGIGPRRIFEEACKARLEPSILFRFRKCLFELQRFFLQYHFQEGISVHFLQPAFTSNKMVTSSGTNCAYTRWFVSLRNRFQFRQNRDGLSLLPQHPAI